MRKVISTLSVVLLLTMATMAQTKTTQAGIYVNGLIPTGLFQLFGGPGVGAGAEFTYMINDQFGIGATAGYDMFGKRGDATDDILGQNKISAIPVLAQAKYYFSNKGNGDFFLKGAAGLSFISTTYTDPFGTEKTNSSSFTFSIGAGVKFNNIQPFIKFNDMVGDGGSLGYFGVGLSVTF